MHAAEVQTNYSREGPTRDIPRPRVHHDRIALIVDADRGTRESLTKLLGAPDLRIVPCSDVEEALTTLRTENVDLVVTAQRPADDSAIRLLEAARNLQPGAARALIVSTIDMPAMCDAINRAGISHLLEAPLDEKSVARLRHQVFGEANFRSDPLGRNGSPSRTGRYGIIGTSPAIRSVIDMIEKVGPTNSSVLITGETGTGKELVGQAIHDVSARKNRTFSAINSAALPETLLESELFGHRRGAFTGANTNRSGLFEHTDGGTVFLDELGEMPLSMQAKLLRFLQTGEVRPVGGETSRHVDVRLVSATNRDLENEVSAGRFRQDLYYRLAVIPIVVPPLRERIEDIPLLANHFLQTRSNGEPRAAGEIESDAMNALMRHSWPGNVRELQNVIERGVALCHEGHIRCDDLPTRIFTPSRPESHEAVQSLPNLQRKHILETLDTVGWNRKQAASLLQISTTTLWRRLKEFGIDEANRKSTCRNHGSSSW